jgi:hypothetical protein
MLCSKINVIYQFRMTRGFGIQIISLQNTEDLRQSSPLQHYR